MYSPMRIGGLASGMDIDQMVFDLMKAERMRYDKLYQQKQIMEWQKADYRAINLKLRTLHNTSFDMRLTSSYLNYKAVGSMQDGTSYDKYFTVTPGSGAAPGDYKVEVKQTASFAELKSFDSITKPLTGEIFSLDELNSELSVNNEFNISIDGVRKTIVLNNEGYSSVEELRSDLQTQINDAFGWTGEAGIRVTENSGKISIQPAKNFHKVPIVLNGVKTSDDEIDSSLLEKLGFKDGAAYRPLNLNTSLKSQIDMGIEDETISFTLNDQKFEFGPNTSLRTILDKINSEDIGVKAHYDTLTDKVVLTSKELGQGAKIEITEDNGLFKALGFGNYEVDGKTIDNTKTSGTNAQITFNGTIVEKATNEFAINGIRFNLNEAMADGQVASFRIENDPDATVESIKKYIELYNETIDDINKKLDEERYRKFPPLTDEQKKEMTEKDIELWEEKARSGHLRSDPLLDRTVSNLRYAVTRPVAGLPKGMNSLSAIGITTADWREKGKLHINEEKLREAIVKDPETVMKLFNASGDDQSSKGIANRIYDIAKGSMTDLTDKAGGAEFEKIDNSSLGKQIRDMDKRISDFEDKLARTEERYWMQFTQMEKAIQAMNQQSMWLMSQMGMYGG